jgi:hypothetical protein
MAQKKKSYLFSWEQYRDEAWWNNLRVETTRRGVSINQLLCDLLDSWLAHGNAAPDESGPVYRLMVEAIKRGEGK